MQQSFSKIKITDTLFCGKHYYEVICMLISNVYRMKRGNFSIERCKNYNGILLQNIFTPSTLRVKLKYFRSYFFIKC